MKWEKLSMPSTEDLKESHKEFKKLAGFKYTRKPRYLVDESLGQGTTQLLKELKLNVNDVWQLGINGQPDENVWRAAQKDQRIILSHDDDFLDNRLFPLRKSYGVAIFPHKDGGEKPLIKKLVHFTNLMAGGMGFIYERKIIISADDQWKIIRLDETGKIDESLYDLADRNHVFELVEEDS
jgi:hypothetical protein